MILLIVLVLFGLLLLGVSVAAFRAINRRQLATLEDLEVLLDSEPDKFAHLPRILGFEDFDYLAASPRRSLHLRRLRKQRVRVMFQALGQMRREFDSLSSIGTLFAAAPIAQAESFGEKVALQRIHFYRMYVVLWCRTLWNYFVLAPFETAPLAAEIRTLRRQSDRLLQAMTPTDLGAIRNTLRSG